MQPKLPTIKEIFAGVRENDDVVLAWPVIPTHIREDRVMYESLDGSHVLSDNILESNMSIAHLVKVITLTPTFIVGDVVTTTETDLTQFLIVALSNDRAVLMQTTDGGEKVHIEDVKNLRRYSGVTSTNLQMRKGIYKLASKS